MDIRWSCFLSFRGGKGNLAVGILDHFTRALANELELQVDVGLYRYTEKMEAGQFIDPTIAGEMTASACMVLLFTGKYFSKINTYCTREYLLMSRLEQSRLNRMGRRPSQGLIIPIILRNSDRVPQVLKRRFCVDFTEFAEGKKGIKRPKKFYTKIKNIANYIVDRYYELENITGHEEMLNLPNDREVHDFIKELTSSLAEKRKARR